MPLLAAVTRIIRHHVISRHAPHHPHHRLVTPPTLLLVRHRLDLPGAIQQSARIRDARPVARLTEIIHAHPDELPGVRRIIPQPQPRLPIMPLLRADNFAFRFRALCGEQLVVAIVCADHVEQISEAVRVIAADIRTKQRLRHGSRRIVLMANLNKAARNRNRDARLGRVVDFVADAVKDHAGMIAITSHGVSRIPLRPLAEEQRVVVRIFLHRPAIEELIHHEKTHSVAEIEKVWRRRIVRRANGVHAEFAQSF